MAEASLALATAALPWQRGPRSGGPHGHTSLISDININPPATRVPHTALVAGSGSPSLRSGEPVPVDC
eukprot:scaffold224841_cov28-Tisochrysis_lutea.AAC.1